MGEFFAFLALFLFGVFLGVSSSTVRVTAEDWNKGQELCSTNGGLDKFYSKTLDPNAVVCNNTAKFILKDEMK